MTGNLLASTIVAAILVFCVHLASTDSHGTNWTSDPAELSDAG